MILILILIIIIIIIYYYNYSAAGDELLWLPFRLWCDTAGEERTPPSDIPANAASLIQVPHYANSLFPLSQTINIHTKTYVYTLTQHTHTHPFHRRFSSSTSFQRLSFTACLITNVLSNSCTAYGPHQCSKPFHTPPYHDSDYLSIRVTLTLHYLTHSPQHPLLNTSSKLPVQLRLPPTPQSYHLGCESNHKRTSGRSCPSSPTASSCKWPLLRLNAQS